MLDVIRSIKHIFASWIFCWWLQGWLLICLESCWLSSWDLFLGKHRLFLGINKIDHVFCSSLQSKYVLCPHWAPLPSCSSLQKGKEEILKDVSRGTALAQAVKLEYNTDKKEILAIGQALVRSLATTFFSVLAGEMNVVYIMGWRTELFTNTIGHKWGSWAGTLLTRSCFKVHFKHNSNPRWSVRWIWEIRIVECFCVSMKQSNSTEIISVRSLVQWLG